MRARDGRGLADGAAVATVVVAALLLQAIIYDRWIGLLDEGFVLQTAAEILRGKVLYRDVVIPAPFPASFYVLAGVFRLFGTTLVVSRLLAVAVFTAMAVCIYRLARSVVPAGVALAVGLVFVAYRVWAFPHWHMVSYSTFAIFFGTLGATLLVGGLPAPSLARCGAVAALATFALLCKQDSGAFMLAALGVTVLLFPPPAGRFRAVLAFGVGGAAVALPVLGYFWYEGALADAWAQTVLMPLKWARSFPYPGLPALRPFFAQDPAFRAQAFGYLPGILFTLYWPAINTGWVYRTTAAWEIGLKSVYYLPIAALVVGALATWVRWRRLEWTIVARRVFLVVLAVGFLLSLNKPRDWIHVMVLYYPTILLVALLACDFATVLPRAVRRAAAGLGWLAVIGLLVGSTLIARDLRAYTSDTVVLPQGTIHATEDEAQVLGEIGRYVAANVPAGAPLPVFPYHPLIQFLLGRDSGTHNYIIWPVSAYADMDARLISDLQRNDVRTIIFSVSQYAGNLRYFQENAPELFAYLVDHYAMAHTFSSRPWGLVMTALRRRDARPEAVGFRFADHLDEAAVEVEAADGTHPVSSDDRARFVGRAVWPFERVVAERPTLAPGVTVLRFTADVPHDARLRLGYGMNPDRWIMAIDRAAVDFSVAIESPDGTRAVLLDERVDAQRRADERRWRQADLDLAPYADRRATFAFRVRTDDPHGELSDLAGWADPRLVQGP